MPTKNYGMKNPTVTYIKDFAKQNPVTTIAIAGGLFLTGRYVYKRFLKPEPPAPKPLPPVPPPAPPTPLPEPPRPSPGGGSSGRSGGYSYDAYQYSDWADVIQQAVDGAGTYEEPIFRVMRYMKTRMDVLALIEAYGKRAIKSPYQLWDTDPMTLPQTLEYDVAEYIDEINEIIKKTGYQF